MSPAPSPSGSLVFYSEFDDFATWRDALHAQIPDLRIVPAGEIDDPAAVHYALTWKAPAGFFAKMPNLRLIINLAPAWIRWSAATICRPASRSRASPIPTWPA